MLCGETTKRSELDPDKLVAKLQAHGVERLRGEAHVWVVVDGSDLRKPHAQEMEHLQRVRRLDGAGTVPGYPTLNVIGIGRERRGLLYHKLYSSAAPDFLSEPAGVRAAIRSVGVALAPLGCAVTGIFDSGFDDQAVWARSGTRASPWCAASNTGIAWSGPWSTPLRATWRSWHRGWCAWPRSRRR